MNPLCTRTQITKNLDWFLGSTVHERVTKHRDSIVLTVAVSEPRLGVYQKGERRDWCTWKNRKEVVSVVLYHNFVSVLSFTMEKRREERQEAEEDLI